MSESAGVLCLEEGGGLIPVDKLTFYAVWSLDAVCICVLVVCASVGSYWKLELD